MNERGEVKSLDDWEKELGEETLRRQIASGLIREVDEKDMTKAQKKRYDNGEQPVVKAKDNRSVLSGFVKQMNLIKEKQRVEKNKIDKRRKKNKAARKARRNNR